MTPEVNNLYEFGRFRFDGAKQELWQKDAFVSLSPKASELLRILLERRGEFVSKDEIFEKVWADTFVEDGVLTQNIYTLRKILGTDENGRQLIENRTRLGYRITVPITVAESSNGREVLPDATASVGDKPKAVREKKSRKKLFVAAACLILLSTAAFFGYRFLRPRIASFFLKPIETTKYQSLTNTGDVYNAALSPDGNFLAYLKNNQVFLKDIVSEKDIRLEIPNAPSLGSLQFSSNGNFLYLRARREFVVSASVLKVSRFGGDVTLVAEKVWGDFALAPDDKQLAFFRQVPEKQQQKLIIKNLETGEERELFTKEPPGWFVNDAPPAWSPDGKKIAFLVRILAMRQSQLFVVDVENGKTEEIKPQQLRQIAQVAWLPDGESLVVAASEGGRIFQLWKIFYPNGDIQRITNGLSSYGRLSVSSDGKKIVAMQTTTYSNIFVADGANPLNQKQLTFGSTNNNGQNSLGWIDDRRIVYPSQSQQSLWANLWMVDAENNSRQQLTASAETNSGSPTSDGKFIYFATNKNRTRLNISRMNIDGGNLTEITNGTDGNRAFPQVSPDGNWLYYTFRNVGGGRLMRYNLREQKEEVFFEGENIQPIGFLSLSPDGKHLVFFNWTTKVVDSSEKDNAQIAVLSTENTSDIKLFNITAQQIVVRASPDGNAFEYVTLSGEDEQILRQNFDGGEPKPILTLPKEAIFNFAWSKSGTRLAVSRGQSHKDAVLLTDFE